MSPTTVTDLLHHWGDGDAAALDRLVPLLYGELHALARRQLRDERTGHTLNPTALVNEAYLKLARQREVRAEDRGQFLAVAATTMRRLLVDYARARKRLKRGGGVPDLALDDVLPFLTEQDADELLALDEALTRLAALDPRASQIVHHRFFGGLSLEETADVLAVSAKTVQRAWSAAQAWLRKEVSPRPLGLMRARWDQIESLFADALALDVAERTGFLETACVGAPGLRREVEAMLDARDRPLGIEARLLAGASEQSPPVGARVGPYLLLEPLGEGGMGAVWRARRVDGVLDREVALKLVRWPGDGAGLRQRFEAERQVLARLEHPGIVRLLEAGTSAPAPDAPGGRPYFAMDLVDGVPITAYAEAHGLDAEARVGLVVQACEAVAHAHRRLVVHRDLKPSNLLVTADGQVKLLDFGIAKLLGNATDAARTETGARAMTRAYAAPEQVRGEAATTATDVYALGVVLYELLAGRRPFEASSPAQQEDALLHATPPRPSATASGSVDARRVRGDLDAVVLTALRAEPEARYGSADALAADLRRFVGGLPVAARAPSAAYRARLFARRHRLGVSAAVAAAVALVAFTAALAVQQRATARERDAAQATAGMLAQMLSADPFAAGRPDTLRLRDVLDRGLAQARTDLADQPLVRARLLFLIGRSYVQLGAHPRAEAPLEEATSILRESGDVATLAAALAELATVRDSQGRLSEAEALAREALRLADRRTAGRRADPALRARVEYVLGLVLIDADRADEAEALLRTAAARSPEAEAFVVEQTLGRAILDQGRLDDAEVLFLDLRERLAERYGPDDPRLAGVLTSLMFLYLMADRLDEAERMGSDGIAILRAAQPTSSTLSQMLGLYGSVLRRQGRLDDAEAALREAIRLPPLRPGAHAVPCGVLASVLAERGDLEGAIEAQREALAWLARDPHTGPSGTAFSQIKLAQLLRDARRFEEAEAALLRVPTDAAGASDHGGPALAEEWAALYDAWGRPVDAARWRARRPGRQG